MIEKENKLVFFICHATEDKNDIVVPLVKSLESLGLNLWYDLLMSIGDEINDEIHKGLKMAKFGVLVFSPNFFLPKKDYPRTEMGALNYKKNEGECYLFPVYYKIDPDAARKKTKSIGNPIGRIITKENVGTVAKEIYDLAEEYRLRSEKSEKPIKNLMDVGTTKPVALIIDKATFKKNLTKRINLGRNLLERHVTSVDTFILNGMEFLKWNTYNSEFLRRSFNSTNNEYEVSYDECAKWIAFAELLRGRSTGPNEHSKKLKECIKKKIENLEQLRNKTSLLKCDI